MNFGGEKFGLQFIFQIGYVICGTTSGTGCGSSNEPGCGTTSGTDDIAQWWTQAESTIKADQLDRLLINKDTRSEILELLQISNYHNISKKTDLVELNALHGKLQNALKEVRNHIEVKSRNVRNL